MGVTFEPFQSDKDGSWYWRVKETGNHEIIAGGVQGFESKRNVDESIANLRAEIVHDALSSDEYIVHRRDELHAFKTRLREIVHGRALAHDVEVLIQEFEDARVFP